MGKKCSSLTIQQGFTTPIYMTSPNVNEKYTKHAGIGQYLQGKPYKKFESLVFAPKIDVKSINKLYFMWQFHDKFEF